MAVTQKDVDEIWKCCDKNGDGHITSVELYEGMFKYMTGKGKDPLSSEACERIFSGIDHSGDKKITKGELEVEMLKRDDRREGLLRDFKRFAEKDGKANISKDEMRTLLEGSDRIKASKVDEMLEAIFKFADKDESGCLDFNEFEAVMNKI